MITVVWSSVRNSPTSYWLHSFLRLTTRPITFAKTDPPLVPQSIMQLISIGLLLSALFVHAVPITHDEIASQTAAGLRLLRFKDSREPVWVTEEEKLEFIRAQNRFFDVTEVWERKQSLSSKSKAAKVNYPAPSHQSEVNAFIETLSTSNMQSNLGQLTSFNNRYYRASTGRQASQFILDTVSAITKGHTNITAKAFAHSWTQFSIVARIPGSQANSPVTIIGGHMDSINLRNPTSGRAPGADDNGSGSVNIIEIFRALVEGGFTPSTPVEFHWYSGEEAGLLGSQDIATSYSSDRVDVKAYMNLDMTGYSRPGTKEAVYLISDNVDDGLTAFLGQLVDEYSRLDWVADECDYACSDHASWNEEGYPAAFPFEATLGTDNPSIHSATDTTDVNGFSWAHSLEFAKFVKETKENLTLTTSTHYLAFYHVKMKEVTAVDEEMIREIRRSVKETADRGLIAASKWSSDLLISIPAHKRNPTSSNPKSAVSEPSGGTFDEHILSNSEMEEEKREEDALSFAQRAMSSREYNRAAYHTQECTSAKAFFIHIYSRFLVSEKNALLEWHDLDGSRTQPMQPINEKIGDLLAEVEASDKTDPFKQFLKALFYFRMSRIEDARKTLCDTLSVYPWNWSAWTLLGNCVDNATALEELLPSIRLPAKHPLPRMFRVKILNELQAATDAEIDLCDELLRETWFPKSLWVMSHRARALYGLSHIEEAEDQFETLLELDPDHIDDIDIYSYILYTTEQTKKLTLLAEMCMKKDKNRPEVCCVVGIHYSLLGEHEKAIKYFRRATQLDRTFINAWTFMGHEYLEVENAPAAIESYRVALAIDTKDYRPWYGLGRAYSAQHLNLPTYALYYYQKASYLRPSEQVLWDRLGECYESAGSHQSALECYKNGVALLMMGDKKVNQKITLHVKIANCYKQLQDPKNVAHHHFLIVKIYDNEVTPIDSGIPEQYMRSLLEVGEYQVVARDSDTYDHIGNLKQGHDYLTWVLTMSPWVKAEEKTRIHALLKEITVATMPRGINFGDKYLDGRHGYDMSYRDGPLFLVKAGKLQL
ncbi:hypothetical protein D9758_012893 [Tetrapyrgos nigripes]|uniref:Peptide hydrolase n=1 Tax=Tetrapyrgos nigripes TaxID=182062 RepID=A0A8H5FP67_9AGAR|nr:hypothetical protein D9758_012893 [Tetrapyrgos nigripes]